MNKTKQKNLLRKISLFAVAAIFLTASLSACGGQQTATESASSEGEDTLNIVTTIFPEYDLVKNITGDVQNINIEMLLDSGVDLHSYQPTAEDIMKVVTCDIFVYVGGESDEWVEDALRESENEDMIVVNLLEELDGNVKEEETVEGMEAEEEDEEGEEEEEIEYDEHVWLSLKNMKILCEKISKAIEEADPDNAQKYEENAATYEEKLDALDVEYEAATKDAKFKTLLFGDRFPFRYLADDYGLEYYAAFSGCSAETEASFETIMFLAGKVDELSLPAVIAIEGTDHRIAETIIENTETKDQKIITLDSMQSVTAKDVADGTDYIDIMEKNLDGIKQALE